MRDTLESRTGALRFQCQMIDVSQISGVDLLASESLSDNLLAILTSDVDQRQAIRRILEKLKDVPAKQRGDHLTQLLIISGMRRLEPLVKEEARSVMPIVLDLMENSVIREIVEQASAEAAAKAKTEATTELLLSMIRHRFAEVPDWAEAKVRAGTPPDLERWTFQMMESSATLEQALA